MRRLAAVTATALLSAATLAAGAATAEASASKVPHPRASHSRFSHRAHGVFAFIHFKRVDLRTHAEHSGELYCLVYQAGDALRIEGIGDLEDATTACRELDVVNGDFRALNVHPTWLTPDIEAPVRVEERGWWRGAEVDYQKVFRNPSELAKSTGSFFDF